MTAVEKKSHLTPQIVAERGKFLRLLKIRQERISHWPAYITIPLPPIINYSISLIHDESRETIPKYWWQNRRYTERDKFIETNLIPHRTRRRIIANETAVGDYQNHLKPKKAQLDIPHYIKLPDQLPKDLILCGRWADDLTKDELYYEQAKKELQVLPDLTRTLFFNYTGHEACIAAALSEKGIPTYWQISKANERILNQIRDWLPQILKNNENNDSSAAIMLEPNHGDGNFIDCEALPTSEYLKLKGIQTVVVFTEDAPGKDYEIDSAYFADQNFKSYLHKLERNGIKLVIKGLNLPWPK